MRGCGFLLFVLFSFTVCAVHVGCNLRPNFGPQGTMRVQQTQSSIHDPFPSNDLGPKLEGVRPLGFERPRSEATSLQRSPYARKSFQRGSANPVIGY